jgi:hypothetical protein
VSLVTHHRVEDKEFRDPSTSTANDARLDISASLRRIDRMEQIERDVGCVVSGAPNNKNTCFEVPPLAAEVAWTSSVLCMRIVFG